MIQKSQIKEIVQGKHFEAFLKIIKEFTSFDELETIDHAARQISKFPVEDFQKKGLIKKKLALMSGATTQFISPLIKLFALKRGILLEIYASEFGLYEQEIYSESEQLREFGPDLIHFHVGSQNIVFPELSIQNHSTQLQLETQRFRQLFKKTSEIFKCSVVCNTFETLNESPYGNIERKTEGSKNRFILDLNSSLFLPNENQFYINDVEAQSARFGKDKWSDPKLWNEYKCALSFAAMPTYADNLAAIMAAIWGKSKKVLVLDLDNTCWGGVIGDDGMDRIKIGEGDPEGEAFLSFQKYVKELKERGVILAVSSKNEFNNAIEPFRSHPQMVLKETDFSSFRANWNNKDQNIRDMALELNLGLDSFVFFDDNPAERELVKTSLPDVTVEEVPEDPSFYVRALDNQKLFETIGVTQEDRDRSRQYSQNRERNTLEAISGNYDEFLANLNMQATLEPIQKSNLARATQLINKTNQFNLTTRRYTEQQVQQISENPNSYSCLVRIKDKFGDYGLISLVYGQTEQDHFTIDLWLMSCRVLKRGVEVLSLLSLIDYCKKSGVKKIIGEYRPTAKNDLVRNHFENLGFVLLEKQNEGSKWVLDLTKTSPVLNHKIQILKEGV